MDFSQSYLGECRSALQSMDSNYTHKGLLCAASLSLFIAGLFCDVFSLRHFVFFCLYLLSHSSLHVCLYHLNSYIACSIKVLVESI